MHISWWNFKPYESSVEGHFNPRLFNPKSGVGKSGVGKFMVEKSGMERSGVEAWGWKVWDWNVLQLIFFDFKFKVTLNSLCKDRIMMTGQKTTLFSQKKYLSTKWRVAGIFGQKNNYFHLRIFGFSEIGVFLIHFLLNPIDPNSFQIFFTEFGLVHL